MKKIISLIAFLSVFSIMTLVAQAPPTPPANPGQGGNGPVGGGAPVESGTLLLLILSAAYANFKVRKEKTASVIN